MPSKKVPTTVRNTVLEGKTHKKHQRKTPGPMPRKGHVHGTDHWDCERILSYKMTPGENSIPFFFVKWAGWKIHESTWEPVGNLTTSKHLVEQYMKKIGKKLVPDELTKTVRVEDLP